MTAYIPKPIDTSRIRLPAEIEELTEKLSENTHDTWSLGRMQEGWIYGSERNDNLRQHPGLVPYDELSDSEKAYDRNTSMQTLKAIYALGYRIVKQDACSCK